ncbi:MAG: aminodeoxychorismate synthase component I [Ornithinimicrobium sp.]
MHEPQILLIDNIDSFTFNIADLVHRVTGAPATVWRHDHEVDPGHSWWRQFAAIIVGPGPGRPDVAADMGLSQAALEQQEVPVLGVCLGHQGLAHYAGWAVAQMRDPQHGRVAEVRHQGTGLFAGVPSPFSAVRYHSLEVGGTPSGDAASDGDLTAIAWSAGDDCVMALEDRGARRWGVQFHPESVLTEHGAAIVASFLVLAGVTTGQGDQRPVSPRPVTVEASGLPLAVRDGDQPGAVGDADQPGIVGDGGRPGAVGDGDQPDTVREVSLRAQVLPGQVFAWDLHERLARLRRPSEQADTSVWLDSCDNRGFSIIADASGPLAYTLRHAVGAGSVLSTGEHLPGPLWDNISQLLQRVHLTADAPMGPAGVGVAGEATEPLPFEFRPGFVGYFGYELKAEDGAPNAYRADTPDAWLTFADRAVVIDHSTRRVYALAVVDDEVRQTQEEWIDAVAVVVADLAAGRPVEPVSPAPQSVTAVSADAQDAVVAASARHTPACYQQLVARAQRYIRAGETYEVCLTNQVSWPDPVDERATYQRLRQLSPGPFGAWLRCGDFSVLSSSPERFVSVSADGVVRAEPIKGTRARDTDPARDAALAVALAADDKERAENLMIVDLLRNDLHRVCEPRSVDVPELFAVRSWATVHQLVSTITGQLRAGLGPADVLRSCFPGGSMTGAPKVRTMQILEELEGGPRGVYSGAIGWVGVNGAMDTSIVIRTIVRTGESATFGIGGAITALSHPQAEYDETVIKARAVATALAAGTREVTVS